MNHPESNDSAVLALDGLAQVLNGGFEQLWSNLGHQQALACIREAVLWLSGSGLHKSARAFQSAALVIERYAPTEPRHIGSATWKCASTELDQHDANFYDDRREQEEVFDALYDKLLTLSHMDTEAAEDLRGEAS